MASDALPLFCCRFSCPSALALLNASRFEVCRDGCKTVAGSGAAVTSMIGVDGPARPASPPALDDDTWECDAVREASSASSWRMREARRLPPSGRLRAVLAARVLCLASWAWSRATWSAAACAAPSACLDQPVSTQGQPNAPACSLHCSGPG